MNIALISLTVNADLSNHLGERTSISTSLSSYTMPEDAVIVVNSTAGNNGGNGQAVFLINNVVRFRCGIYQNVGAYCIITNSDSFRVNKGDVLSWNMSGNGTLEVYCYPYA